MRRLILCAVIFLAVAAGSAASLKVLKSATDGLIERVEQVGDAHDGETREIALAELEDYWDSYYKKSSFITRSRSLEEMSVSVSGLRFRVGAELDSELDSIRERAEMICEDQVPHLSGIL